MVSELEQVSRFVRSVLVPLILANRLWIGISLYSSLDILFFYVKKHVKWLTLCCISLSAGSIHYQSSHSSNRFSPEVNKHLWQQQVQNHIPLRFIVCVETTETVEYSLCFRAVRRSLSGSILRFEAVPLDQEATEGAQVTFTCQGTSNLWLLPECLNVLRHLCVIWWVWCCSHVVLLLRWRNKSTFKQDTEV